MPEFKEGEKVRIWHEAYREWLPAVVTRLERPSERLTWIFVAYEDHNGEIREFNFPADTLLMGNSRLAKAGPGWLTRVVLIGIGFAVVSALLGYCS